jgi:glucose-1-phosphate thymidylyltransferase
MKGIVLAGGTGSRLFPITSVFSKQLLPVYNKPMIHYPISTLMAAGISEILIITTPRDQILFKELLGSGSDLGVNFSFIAQKRPAGIPEAFIIGADFIDKDNVALVLGDNIFFGSGLGRQLAQESEINGAKIFGYHVSDPQHYGVAELDSDGKVVSIIEKPKNPKSNIAVTGLYFYDNSVIQKSSELSPSDRGELEITDVNLSYLRENLLALEILPRGTAWLDTGTFDALHDASTFIKVMEERQGTKIACLEEISWRNGWISDTQLSKLSDKQGNQNIQEYLRSLVVS